MGVREEEAVLWQVMVRGQALVGCAGQASQGKSHTEVTSLRPYFPVSGVLPLQGRNYYFAHRLFLTFQMISLG